MAQQTDTSIKLQDAYDVTTSKFTGIDIFSGAGGLSLGAEMAGVNVKYAVEVWPSAADTYEHNHKEAKVICKDIKEITAEDFVDCQSPFIVMGGPPCQGFSMSNTRNRTMENPKNHLFEQFVVHPTNPVE